MSNYKSVEVSRPKRVQDLSTPLIGEFLSERAGVHGPVYRFKTEQGVIELYGSSELNMRMEVVPRGAQVSVRFLGEKRLEEDKKVFLVDVGVEDAESMNSREGGRDE